MKVDFDPMNYETDLYILYEWLKNRSLNVEIREHPVYNEVRDDFPTLARVAGTDQILVSSPNGQISVIRGQCSFGDYEIYSREGDLFEDIERYPDVKTTGERIYQLLTKEEE